MGTKNRQRRAQKHRARRNSSTGRPSGARAGSTRDGVDSVLFELACSAEHGAPGQFEDEFDAMWLVTQDRDQRVFGNALMALLIRSTRAAWEAGWQPADLARVTARRRGARGPVEGVTRWAIAEEARASGIAGMAVPDAWSAQLAQLAAGAVSPPRWSSPDEAAAGVQVLGLLTHLPGLPFLMPPPSQWGRERPARARPEEMPGVDGRMLAKVRALLAKAESTDFEEEAESLTAKAQELMARYSIDQAMVAGVAAGETPIGRRFGVDDSYADPKSLLLSKVADANRCQAIWMPELGFSTVFGYAADVDNVELLFTSLLVQATRAMTTRGSVKDRSGRSRTRSYRQSFLVSFAIRIGERLRAATARATEEAGEVHGPEVLPVLAGRRAEVDDAVAAVFPTLRSSPSRASNWEGWVAGRVAADQAHLGPERTLLDGLAV